MTWDIQCDSWEAFPVMQKWFATGEAISHLRYQEEEGKVLREEGREKMEGGSKKIRFRLDDKK